MSKVIIVESCRSCAYLGFNEKHKRYVCMLYSTDVTEAVEHRSIHSQCQLDDAVVEKKFFQDPAIVASEGNAICIETPANDAFNTYLVGGKYRFQRQVDGNIRLYLTGLDSSKYMVYHIDAFNQFFSVQSEEGVDLSKLEVCEMCRRPKKWCECL